MQRQKGEPLTAYKARLKTSAQTAKTAKATSSRKKKNEWTSAHVAALQSPRPVFVEGADIRIELEMLVPGLNGKDGLLRTHFTQRRRDFGLICTLVRASKPKGLTPISTPTEAIYVRYTTQLMDWDNACASFKLIGDALQEEKIITDDSPKVLVEFTPIQILIKKLSKPRTVVILRPITEGWVRATKSEFEI